MTKALDTTTSWWQLIEERAALTPDRPFVNDEAGRTLTFGQYRDRAVEVAAGLHDLGVRSEHVVSWQLPSTLEGTVLMAALCRLGVRQNPIVPILRRTEVGLITHQVHSDFLVVPGTYRQFDFTAMARDAVPDGCTVIDTSTFAADSKLSLPHGDPASLPLPVDPGRDVRWYYYSSGTTASPKGAMHTDTSVMASSNAQIASLDLAESDLFPVPFPITHIGGIMLLTAYLRVGAQLLFIEAFDPSTSPLAMSEHGATVLGSATPFFHAYLAAQREHGDEPLFPELRQLQAGGAPITPELNAECVRTFGSPIYNQWGLTEFPAATSLGVGDPPSKFEGSVGKMAPGCELKVVDFDGALMPTGDEGELWVRGPQRLAGYVDSSLDADAFDDEGYFRSGDLGTIDDDGFVRITGRLKDIIIRNAENLSAQEMEDVLAEHPSVADVAVIGLPDERTGERACALVVLAPGADPLTIADLADHCIARGLAKQKIPEQLEIIAELPRNPMGKVLKHELRAGFVKSD
jgi:acyl-CoA synthetase (AMP-forming)/AMP-acid ligase II